MKTGNKSPMSALKSNFRHGFSANFSKYCSLFAKKHQDFTKKHQNLAKSYQNSYFKVFSFVNSSRLLRPAVIGVLSFILGLAVGMIFNPVRETIAVEGFEPSVEMRSDDASYQKKSQIEKIELDDLANRGGYVNTTASYSTPTNSSFSLQISKIGLYTNVSQTYVDGNNNIIVPDYGVGVLNEAHGRHFALLVGHRAGIFRNLDKISVGDTIVYNGQVYTVTATSNPLVSEISMYSVTKNSNTTINLMTCDGPNNSRRIIITASL